MSDVLDSLRVFVAAVVRDELARAKPAAVEHISAAEYAERYSISLTTVRDAIREGRLEHKRIGRSVRIPGTAQIESRRSRKAGARMRLLRGGRP